MKMQIEDLMDLYVGEDAAELGERLPPLPEPGKGNRKPVVPRKKHSHVRRTVGIAASILIVLGIAGALMLAILGGGAFWYLKQRKKKESKPQPSYDEYEDDEDDETGDDDLNE